jgi:phosphoribosylformylglycinamidine cyclo-ligase
VFGWLAEQGPVKEAEMRRAFNMGLGMIAVVAPADAPGVLAALLEAGEDAMIVGEVVAA